MYGRGLHKEKSAMKICRCMALLLVCASCSDRDARGVRVTTAMAASVPGSGAEPVDVDPASLTPPAALRVEEFAIPNAIGACAAASPYPHDPAVDAATGHVYYTDTGESCIGRLNPDTLEFTFTAYDVDE